ncbi:hypothetical protein ACFE04_006734 [Oxalis oulophora]
MKNSKQCIVFLLFSFILPLVLADLRVGFYSATCPTAESIVRQVVAKRFGTDKSIAAALLRMHFHDCLVRGCDASILIDSTKQKQSEKDAGPNDTVRGFDLIDEVKKALELACPQKVSCADIITLATRDAVALSNGPSYMVPTGRRDGLVSNPDEVNLPGPQLSVSEAFEFFKAKGLTLNEMVTLLGAHSIGVAHCSFFQDRLSFFQGTNGPDPTMNRTLVSKLNKICGAANNVNPDPTAFLDQGTSFTLDNQFYKQIQSRNGVMQIDQELALDSSTRGIVAGFASNQNGFFSQSFANAMVRLSRVEVLVGTAGEIRRNCRVFNGKVTPSPTIPIPIPIPSPKPSPSPSPAVGKKNGQQKGGSSKNSKKKNGPVKKVKKPKAPKIKKGKKPKSPPKKRGGGGGKILNLIRF